MAMKFSHSSSQCQLPNTLDLLLAIPRGTPHVARFLFESITTTPFHPSFPLRLSALKNQKDYFCISKLCTIRYAPDPLYPPAALHNHCEIAETPQDFDTRTMLMKEDTLFFPVGILDDVVIGYFCCQKKQENFISPSYDPFTLERTGRFAFHIASKALLTVVCDGDPLCLGIRLYLPRSAQYRDFVQGVTLAAEYGPSKLPTQLIWAVTGSEFLSPVASMWGTNDICGEEMGNMLDDFFSKNDLSRAPSESTLDVSQPSMHKTIFGCALYGISNTLCSAYQSPGLRLDVVQGNMSFSGRLNNVMTVASPEITKTMKNCLTNSLQLAYLYTLLQEPYIALSSTNSVNGRRRNRTKSSIFDQTSKPLLHGRPSKPK